MLESSQAALEQADREAGTELEGEEEATPITYDYEQLKSKPEMVNVSTDNMLQLLYPPTTLHLYLHLSWLLGSRVCPLHVLAATPLAMSARSAPTSWCWLKTWWALLQAT